MTVEAEALIVLLFFLILCVLTLLVFVLLTVLRDNKEIKQDTTVFFHETIQFIKLITDLYENGKKEEGNQG